jgi:hypothetical protein
VTALQSVQVAGSVLAGAVLLGTIVTRLLPHGAWRRRAEDLAIVLGCASPVLALLGPYLRGRLWPGAAIIAAGYGGYFLIRTRQLRRAERDGVRRLLGLHRDATYGEVLQQVERIEPRPITPAGRVVLVAGAVAALAAGQVLGRFEIAALALLLGAAETTVRGHYHRALATKVRDIGL